MSIGTTLRRLREKNDWTQVEVSRRARISQSTYSAYESGASIPKIQTLSRLADVFGVSVAVIDPSLLHIGRADHPGPAPQNDVEPFHGKVADFPVISEAAAAQCNTAFIPIADWADQQAEERVSFSEGRAGDFVLRVSGESMLPWYPPNTLILARPNERPKNGDRVIAVLGSGEVVFKVFAENGEYFYLLSVNDADGQNFKFRKTDFAAVRAIYLVIQSMRDERALDRAMEQRGISHFWQERIKNL